METPHDLAFIESALAQSQRQHTAVMLFSFAVMLFAFGIYAQQNSIGNNGLVAFLFSGISAFSAIYARHYHHGTRAFTTAALTYVIYFSFTVGLLWSTGINNIVVVWLASVPILTLATLGYRYTTLTVVITAVFWLAIGAALQEGSLVTWIKSPGWVNNEAYNLAAVIGIVLLTMLSVVLMSRLTARQQYFVQSLYQSQAITLGDTSHEIRNALNLSFSMLHELQHSPALRDADRKFLLVLASANESIGQIANDILDVKSLAAQSSRARLNSLDLHQMCTQLSTTYDAFCAQRSIKYTPEFDLLTLPRYITTDGSKLEQIIHNLMGNAIKFTEKGAVTLKIEHRASKLLIEIRDTGIGIPTESLRKIFSRFIKADQSSKNSLKGNGIGLSIVKEFVNCLDGDINVDSTPNVGTCFTIIIPAEICSEPHKKHLKTAKSLDSGPQINLCNFTIQLVDDCRDNLFVLERCFANTGVNILTAPSVDCAISQHDKEKIDIVLTDINLAESSGIELFNRLKELRSALPIVAITGETMPKNVARIKETEFAAVLTKPINRDVLLTTVMEVLEH